jgi:hypothetical protein
MKRILFACFLLTATCGATFVQPAVAQTSMAVVTAADFNAKVNQLDAQIAAGNTTGAQATWSVINDMMKSVLGASKSKIASAATPADREAAMTLNRNQVTTYRAIWGLKNDLTANRTALHTQLGAFAGTIN